MIKIKAPLFCLYFFSAIIYGSQQPQNTIALNSENREPSHPKKPMYLTVQKRQEKVPSHEELLNYPRKNFLQGRVKRIPSNEEIILVKK